MKIPDHEFLRHRLMLRDITLKLGEEGFQLERDRILRSCICGRRGDTKHHPRMSNHAFPFQLFFFSFPSMWDVHLTTNSEQHFEKDITDLGVWTRNEGSAVRIQPSMEAEHHQRSFSPLSSDASGSQDPQDGLESTKSSPLPLPLPLPLLLLRKEAPVPFPRLLGSTAQMQHRSVFVSASLDGEGCPEFGRSSEADGDGTDPGARVDPSGSGTGCGGLPSDGSIHRSDHGMLPNVP